jgi:hypothetical protein
VTAGILIGYVVVKRNQASGEPRVLSYSGFGGGDVFWTLEEAVETADSARVENQPRRETYEVYELRTVQAALTTTAPVGATKGETVG